jgi:inorganic pyrophosphatase
MSKSKKKLSSPVSLGPFADEQDDIVNVIVETPKASRNKFKFDAKLGVYELSSVLPRGMTFPFDFGFIPDTEGEDGDPLDIMILMDEPAFPGCLVKCRVIGVMEAEQSEDGETFRNDRILSVSEESHEHREIKDVTDIDKTTCKELEDFFISYNKSRGKKFKVVGLKGAGQGLKLVKKSRLSKKKAA